MLFIVNVEEMYSLIFFLKNVYEKETGLDKQQVTPLFVNDSQHILDFLKKKTGKKLKNIVDF